ncbi:MAG: tRNA (adenosine(37)-N6)-threonylcarbamoyltransferase complex dimerization subunit type 1 TsaB [Thermoguttaceae bacterium]|jgi:tRNA threonylcarbamoyladenosine biosynthesis protein TsaB|nr:tRNA (adenosine(37)-N6)-threonylcarbamoyltransferase complex dimerization subunit type 1 TsaB [Thermoguttaceae bacterium]
MRILALETSEKVATVAVAEDSRLLATQPCDPAMRSAQSLVPGIQQLLHTAQWQPRQVDLVAVSIGPGSFTGLRVGVVAAKVFAYAVGAEVLGVDTLEAIAAGAPPEAERFWTAVDAQRGQWVVREFRRSADEWPGPVGPAELVDAEPWLAGLPEDTVITGPVLHKAAAQLPKHVRPLAAELWPPTAKAVAVLAARDYDAGRRDDLWTLAPRYSRPSAAEEKLCR